MNLFSFSSLIVIISSLILIVLVLIKGKDKRLSYVWALFCFFIALWGVGGFGFSTAKLPDKAFFWWQIAHIGIIFTPVVYYHFVYAFLKLKQRYAKLLLILAYTIGIAFTVINFLPRHDLFLGDVRFSFNEFYLHYWPIKKNILYLVFYIFFYWIFLTYSFALLILQFIHSKGVVRNQIKYFILASVIGWLGPHGVYSSVFGSPMYPFSNIFLAIYPFIITYAVIKYRLLDIRLAITRAGLFIAVYTLVLGFPFALAGYYRNWFETKLAANWWILPMVLMAALATIGPFFYIFLQRRTEERLLREQKRYQDTLKHAAIGMTRIRNLRKLLSLIAHIITKTVRIRFAAIYLHSEENNEYALQVNRSRGEQPARTLTADHTLITWLITKKQPVVYEEVKRQMQDSNDATFKLLEQDLRKINAAVVIPCFLENKLTAFVVLGDKLSGQIYTPEDLNVFQILASQAALAIENAQFYEEAKEMQAQIAQAEKMATVGTMADGLSHQINNRFYALSLIAGDSIDTIKLTDTSKCSPEIQEMIKQINAALERIQSNVMQGGEVVKGILKYTRKGDEGLEPLTLDQVIDGTITMVQYKVKLQEIDLVRNYPQDLPKIKGNLVQLEEAFFNFIDNAYDSMVERRTTLKEPGYRGKITVTARPKEKMMEIIVQDNGMGVKSEDIKKLFTPFFTTKVSSRKGTGLGLYVIKNIITETHQGKINFESEHKVGTRFILELPLAVNGNTAAASQ